MKSESFDTTRFMLLEAAVVPAEPPSINTRQRQNLKTLSRASASTNGLRHYSVSLSKAEVPVQAPLLTINSINQIVKEESNY